jgi:hypothetical protein
MFGRSKNAAPLKAKKWGVPVVGGRSSQAPQQDRQQAGVTSPQRQAPQQSRQQAGVTSAQYVPQQSRLDHFQDAADRSRQ